MARPDPAARWLLRETPTYATAGSARRNTGIERLVNGIALTQPDHEARIAFGGQVFDALYEAWRRKRT